MNGPEKPITAMSQLDAAIWYVETAMKHGVVLPMSEELLATLKDAKERFESETSSLRLSAERLEEQAAAMAEGVLGNLASLMEVIAKQKVHSSVQVHFDGALKQVAAVLRAIPGSEMLRRPGEPPRTKPDMGAIVEKATSDASRGSSPEVHA